MHHLNLSGKVVESLESLNMIFDDGVRMVFELCIDLLISYLWIIKLVEGCSLFYLCDMSLS